MSPPSPKISPCRNEKDTLLAKPGTLNAGEITEDAIVRLSMGLRAEQMPMTA